MTLAVIIASIVVVIVVVGWFLATRRHPEDASSHRSSTTWTTPEQPSTGSDRPAGPDAETMDPDRLGGDHRPPPTGSGGD